MNEIDKMLKEKNNINVEGEIKKLLKKNLEMTVEVYEIIKKVKSYIMWQQIFSFLKLLIIVIPIILGILYLPPLLQPFFKQLKFFSGIDFQELINLLKNR